MPGSSLYTVGHSNLDIETFLGLLKANGIQRLVDVRTSPNSRFYPHFRRKALEEHLRDAGIEYVYAGEALGGRPRNPECYDESGQLDYQRVEQQDWYRAGIDRLVAYSARSATVMMCSEEDPDRCHRRFLIARTLLGESRAEIVHIRRDGRLEVDSAEPSASR
jgi:uncharacterized protein (DUF488 family)